ncbi:MAG: Trk system potassium transporter TrkA [Spirochaetaceae bacterium]|jgi:trk system potassium uptake protein TrkA|nr:Trk system potassium transporter TrkA [Spirochaetaceae bacterium]
MRIIIVGAGLVGTQLSRSLIEEKHDVSLIESQAERARYASNRLDCLVIHDEGNSQSALAEAGIAKADALVCVTGSDEVNMLICGLAASQYPGILKIARVRNDEYIRLNRSRDRLLGIDHFVHPDVEAARYALNAIEHGALGDILAFAGTAYQLGSIDIAPESLLDGLPLTRFHTLIKGESLVTLLERQGESILPEGATVLRQGDRIHVLAKEKELKELFTCAGRSGSSLRKIGIVGGGRLGMLIAEGLLAPATGKSSPVFSFLRRFMPKSLRRVVIIEQDYGLCKDLAARFPEALVLNEDISDESFVAEERITDLDLIVTATGHQELNIITAVYLKSRGVRRAVALVTGAGYGTIARQLGVDVVIPMKSVVVDSIRSHLMGGAVKGIHRIGDGSVGVIELEIEKASPLANKPITEFRLSGGGLVLLVNRAGDSFIPKGDYCFRVADRVILITPAVGAIYRGKSASGFNTPGWP